MTTMEKLFAQIFDRKCHIINQAKQQADSFTQHLAAKLLIDGITPPAWLLNPSFDAPSSSNPIDLKKELLSELLLPHPQPTTVSRGGFCSLYSQPVALGGTHVSVEGTNLVHEPNEIESALNAPAQNVRATSLQGQIAVRNSDVITELANGVSSKDFSFENLRFNGGCNAEDKLTPLPRFNSNTLEVDQSIISPLGQNEMSAARDQSLSRIQRSKSRQKALELRKTNEKAVKRHQSETNMSGVSYNEGETFTIATSQQQPHQDSKSLALANYSETTSHIYAYGQALGESLSKEKDTDPYRGRITRSKKACNLSAEDGKSKYDNAMDVTEVDVDRTIRSHYDGVEGIPKHVRLSKASSQRVTRSKSGPSEKFPLNYLDSHRECHSQNASSPEFYVYCPDSNNIIEQKEKPECLIGTEVILEGRVELQAAGSESKLDGADFHPAPSSNCMTVEPKTLDFEEIEKDSLIEVISPMAERQSLEKSLERRQESAKFHASPGKVTCISISRKSEKQSLGEENQKRIAESLEGSFETCIEKGAVVEEQVTEPSTIKDVEDYLGVDEEIENSPVRHVEQIRSSDADLDVNMLMHQKKEEASSNHQVQKCELSCNQMIRGDGTTSSSIDYLNVFPLSSSKQLEANDGSTTLDVIQCNVEENQNMTTFESGVDGGLTNSDSVLLHEKSSVRDSGLLCDAVYSCSDGKHFTSDEMRELKFLEESSMLGRKLTSAAENTWSRLKRRKIENQGTTSISADVCFKVKESHYTGGSLNNRNLNTVGSNLRTSLQSEGSSSSLKENAAQSDDSKNPDVELQPYMLTQETESFPEMPIEQDELGSRQNIQCESFRRCVQDPVSMSFAASSLSTGDANDSKASFGLDAGTADATSTVLDESMQGFEQDYEVLVHFENDVPIQNNDESTRYEKTFLETKPYVEEDGFRHSFLVASPQDKHLVTNASDDTMPEFEGFIIGDEDSRQRRVLDDALDSLDLPTTSVERASVLEQLCKSAIMHTPLYQFSAAHKFHRTPDVHHSVPTLNSNDDGCKRLGVSNSCEDELDDASEGMCPDSIPISDTYFDQSLTFPPTSPVSKPWTEFHQSLTGRVSSESLSSEKKLSSNPDLTCFPIEEDPSFSEEEEEDKDEVANSTQGDISSSSMDSGDKRNPLTDITQENVNPPPPVSAAKKSQDRNSLDSVDTEINFTGTHGGVKRKLGERHSKKGFATNETRKKLTLSTSTSSMGTAKESLNNGYSKPVLSRKTSLRNGGQSVAGKESKHNNIISNVSSFVPLVQQKQAAAVITGKRDVKVKALEAAEAAKRLEEKKDNERKLKKETLKLERARLEQENLRQAELNRKKKEDELKRKEADFAARKRVREEEEKKEKERKRRRFEGKRQQNREQEGKLRARKLEKELPVAVINAKLKSGTVIADALQKLQKAKADVDKSDWNNVKKLNTESVASKLENDVRKPVLEGFEALGHSCVSTEVTKTSRGKSYEISPYQSSDDEDDEDDEVSPRKFVPAWSSKKSLALVVFSSQQDVDPDVLFASKSLCSVEEV